MSDALAQKAVDLISQVQSLAPQVTQAAIASTQAGGVVGVTLGFIFLAVTVGGSVWGWRLLKRDNDACIFLFFAAFMCAVAALFNLADPWVWVAAAQPKLALVHDLLQRLLK